MTTSVSAYSIVGDGTVNYSGTLSDVGANKMISFTVVDENTDISDISVDNTLAYRQVISDSNGEYSVTFKVTGKSRYFDIYIGCEGMEEYNKISEVLYILESENAEARESIIGAADSQKVYEILENHLISLDCNKSIFDKISLNTVSDVIFINKSLIDFTTIESASSGINLAGAISGISDGILSAFDYCDLICNDETIKKYMKEDFMSENAQKLVNSYFAGIKSFSEFDSVLIKAVADATIKYADGYEYVREYLTEYAGKLGIDSSKLTEDVCRKMLGQTYADIGEAVNKLYESPKNENSESSDGGSSKVKNVTSVAAEVVSGGKQTLPTIDSVKSVFADLDEYDWAKEAIYGLQSAGIVNGKSKDLFAPGDTVMREEFSKMIMETVNFSELDGEIKFTDVKRSDWFYPYIKNAYLANIVNGISDTEFGAGMKIKREDMAVIAYNALVKYGIKFENINKAAFIDADDINAYAQEAVNALSSIGVISGDENGRFNPAGNATRAEAAKVVYSILTYINNYEGEE